MAIVMCIIMFLIGAFLLYFGMIDFLFFIKLRKKGKCIVATVINVKEELIQHRGKYYYEYTRFTYTFEYMVDNKKIKTNYWIRSENQDYAVGDEVEIVCIPDDPKSITLPKNLSNLKSWIGIPILLFVLSLLLIIAALILMITLIKL